MPEATTTTTTDTTTDAGDANNGAANGAANGAGGEPKTFTQEELDRIVGERLARERSKLGDVDDLRRKAAEYDKLSEAQKTELEKAVDRTRQETEKTVRAEERDRWLSVLRRSEVRAAAAGKLADPEDAVRFLDLDTLEVDDEGRLDEKKVAAAIDELVKTKPYLGANGTRQRTDFDAGPRTPAPGGEDVNARIRQAAGLRT